MKLIFPKGSVLFARLVLAIISSIILIVTDLYFKPFVEMREKLDTAISPFYYVVDGSAKMISGLSALVETKEDLANINKRLVQQLTLQNSDLLILAQLKQDNATLRSLLNSPVNYHERKMLAEVVSREAGYYDNQIVINKGSREGVFVGQAVI